MNAAKHTPGPWMADEADVIDGERDVEATSSRLNGGFIIARLSGSDRAANALLISAAPELLAALNELLCDVGRASSLRGAVMARAAIRKATGSAA